MHMPGHHCWSRAHTLEVRPPVNVPRHIKPLILSAVPFFLQVTSSVPLLSLFIAFPFLFCFFPGFLSFEASTTGSAKTQWQVCLCVCVRMCVWRSLARPQNAQSCLIVWYACYPELMGHDNRETSSARLHSETNTVFRFNFPLHLNPP